MDTDSVCTIIPRTQGNPWTPVSVGDTMADFTLWDLNGDSIVLSDTAIKAARQYIKENFDKEYLPEEPRVYKSKVKNTQEAHEAIRPAGEKFVTLEEIKDIFEEESDEFKIYKLIFNQTIASQMNDAYGKTVTIEAEITFDSEEISDSKVIEKILLKK